MYSNLGSGDFQVAMTIVRTIFYFESHETIFMMLMFPLEVVIIIILKNSIHNPRPFWAAEEIHPEECSASFGDPSGHAYCSGYFVTYLYFTFIWPVFYTNNFQKMTIWRWAGLVSTGIISLLAMITMDISRIYLGMHAINQVLFGSQAGIWTAVMALWVLRPSFENFMKELKSSS